MPKFSIILPVRNGGEYVKQCVGSILAQSNEDFNLHVLDNCSTDGTLQWVQSLNNEKVIVYPAEKSLTIEENWGRIVNVPKNEFITLIGHDDILDRDYLSVMDDLIRKHPNASLYQTHFRYIDAKGGTIRRSKPMDEVQNTAEFVSFFLADMIDTMGTGFMARASDYDSLKGIPDYPNLLFADFELWINLTRKSYKATAFNECFAFRLHQSTTTTSPDIKFHLAFKRFVEYLNGLKSVDRQTAESIERYSIGFLSKYCKGLAHRLLRTPTNKRQGESVKLFLSHCKEYADLLVPGNDFDPTSSFSVRLASQLDSNSFLRWLFLRFKKIYPKPVYS